MRLKKSQWSHAPLPNGNYVARDAMSAAYINQSGTFPAGCLFRLPTTDIVVLGADRIKPIRKMNTTLDNKSLQKKESAPSMYEDDLIVDVPPTYDEIIKTRHAKRH